MGVLRLDATPCAEVGLPSLVQTDNKLLNKVILVCAHLCEEVSTLSTHARDNLLPSLLLLSAPSADTSLLSSRPEAEAAAALPLLLSLLQFVNRSHSLTINIVHQLASLYSAKQRLFAATFKKVHMRRVFQALGELFAVLIYLDDVLQRASRLPPSLSSYRRIMQNMRADPARYGCTPTHLSALDSRLGEVEDALFRGLIFGRAIRQPFDVPGELAVGANAQFMGELLDSVQ